MFRLMLFAVNNKNAVGTFKDVCHGDVFSARHFHKCAPFASHDNKLTHSPPNGLLVTSYDDVVNYLKNPAIRNVMVLAGAGISTPCGIPDFRTPGTGLYDNLKRYHLPYPEAIFDISFFCRDPIPFFSLAKEIYPGNFKPGVAHHFVKMLDLKNKLLRMYTQNIDGLEKCIGYVIVFTPELMSTSEQLGVAGIPASKLVEAHGTFSTATCIDCGTKYNGDSLKEEIFADKVPRCKEGKCGGVVKPDIVFFGEMLPDRFAMYTADLSDVDLMIIMGTSLVVQPFSSLADMVSGNVPRLLLNKTDVFSFNRKNDIFKEGNVEDLVPEFVQKIGWSDHFRKLTEA